MRPVTSLSPLLALLAVVPLALGGCGGGDSGTTNAETDKTKTEKASAGADAGAARTALEDAAAKYNNGHRAFLASAPADLKKGDLTAAKADAARFRNVVFAYDADVRRISIPTAARAQLNDLLGASRTTIADLDAFGAAKDAAGLRSALQHYFADNAELVQANNALDSELASEATPAPSGGARRVTLSSDLPTAARLGSALRADVDEVLARGGNPYHVPAGTKVRILSCGPELSTGHRGRCTFSVKGASGGHAIQVTVSGAGDSATYTPAGSAPAPTP